MSLQFASLGTNYETYSMNWDRNGGWANYLQQLSLQNNHDRQMQNGELNTTTGMQKISFASPLDKHPMAHSYTGHPIDESSIRPNNFKVDVKPSKAKKAKVERMKKIGLNPRYLGATGV